MTLHFPPHSCPHGHGSPPVLVPRGTRAVPTAPAPVGRSAAMQGHSPSSPRGSSASAVIPAMQMWCFRGQPSQLTPGVWPPKSLGYFLQPMLLHHCLALPAAGMLYAKYYSEDFALQCLTGADSSGRSEHYHQDVSRWHGLSRNANLTEELAFSASCP